MKNIAGDIEQAVAIFRVEIQTSLCNRVGSDIIWSFEDKYGFNDFRRNTIIRIQIPIESMVKNLVEK